MDFVWESKLWKSGHALVAGVDEAGRGAWAGPLVSAAVVIDGIAARGWTKQRWYSRVADSKTLSPKVREWIFDAVKDVVPWALGIATSEDIDRVGVGEANRRAVRMAVARLRVRPSFVFVDYVARLGPEVANVSARTLIDGDAKVFSVALASIVAKVQRDRMMQKYDEDYPGYGFGAHKGYGTAEHLAALRSRGLSPIHRRSYRPVRACLV